MKGKVYFDWAQNARGKTISAPYVPRAYPGAPVATPLSWNELESVYPTDFTLRTVPERLEHRGDPWAGILDAKEDLAATVAGRQTG